MNNIVFMGNCQSRALSEIYTQFVAQRTGDRIGYVASYREMSEGDCRTMEQADILIEQVVDVSTKTDLPAAESAARRVLVPLVACSFLWPFAGEEHPLNTRTWYNAGGPYPGEMSDGFLNRQIGQSVPPDEAADNYLALDFSAARLDRQHEIVIDRQRHRDELCEFRIADEIIAHFRDEVVFTTPHHPTRRITLCLAEQLFRRLAADQRAIDDLHNRMLVTPFPKEMLPIHPKVAKHFGLTYAGADTRFRYSREGLVTFRQFAIRYMRFDWNRDLAEGMALAASDPAAARSRLECAVAACPDSADGHYALGDVLARLGDNARALIAFQDGIRLNDGDGRYHHGVANVLLKQQNWAGGLPHARRATALDPANYHYHAALAHLALGAGALDEAYKAALMAVELAPNNAQLRNLVALVCAQRGQLPEAEDAVRQAIALLPEQAGFHHHLSVLLSRRDRLEGAIAASRSSIALDSGNFHFPFHLSQLLERAGRIQEAEAALRAAVTMNPTLPLLHDHLSHLLVRAGRHPEAIEAFQAALMLDPDSAPRLASLSHTLNRVDRRDEAIAAIQRAIVRSPGTADFHIHLGNLLRAARREADAEAAYTQALALDPGSVKARDGLESVRQKPVPLPAKGNDRTAIGRDGWLFHRIDAVFEQVCSDRALSAADQARILTLWEVRQGWCQARGIDYRILIVPERHALYPDKLPPGSPAPHPDRPALRLLRAADPALRPALLYPDETIRRGRAVREVCYRTDVHWSRWGAYLAYRELMHTLPGQVAHIVPESALIESEIRVLGDLTLWLDRRDREPALLLEPPLVNVTEVFSTRSFKPGQVEVFETDRHHLPTLVLFRTSNSTHLLPFLFHHFSRVVAVADTAVLFDLLHSERPDVVISEISERYLANPSGPNGAIAFPRDFDGPGFEAFTGEKLPLPRGERAVPAPGLEQLARRLCTKAGVPESQWHLYLGRALQAMAPG